LFSPRRWALGRLFDRRDAAAVVALVGATLVVHGVAQLSVPAAYIVAGGALVALAWWRIR
jgi:hypothetical protein